MYLSFLFYDEYNHEHIDTIDLGEVSILAVRRRNILTFVNHTNNISFFHGVVLRKVSILRDITLCSLLDDGCIHS